MTFHFLSLSFIFFFFSSFKYKGCVIEKCIGGVIQNRTNLRFSTLWLHNFLSTSWNFRHLITSQLHTHWQHVTMTIMLCGWGSHETRKDRTKHASNVYLYCSPTRFTFMKINNLYHTSQKWNNSIIREEKKKEEKNGGTNSRITRLFLSRSVFSH